MTPSSTSGTWKSSGSSIDRANLNPPKKVQGNPNGFIHWDSDTSLDPLPIGVQGVLSLVKQDGDVGGFQCIPELFYNFDEWVKTQPADRDPMHPDTTGLRSPISRWSRAT